MYLRSSTLSFIIALVSFLPVSYAGMCVDAKKMLRCVIPEKCNERRLIASLECPTKTVCCIFTRSNPYHAMRTSDVVARALYGFKPPSRTSSTPTTALTTSTTESPTVYGRPLNIESQDSEPDPDAIIFPDYISDESEKSDVPDYISEVEDTIDSDLEDKELYETSKSDYYCRKYAQLTTQYTYYTPAPGRPRKRVLEDACRPPLNPLIIDGIDAKVGEFPHMAALGFNKSYGIDYICGGTLISDNFILTAAHCANTRWGPPVQAFMGHLILRSKDGVTVPIERAIIHPRYQPPSLYHDIALLQLDRKLSLSLDLRPACLPSRVDERRQALETPGSVTLATGWGRTRLSFGETILKLQKVKLELTDSRKCREFYKAESGSRKLLNGITSNLICAGGWTRRSQDTCQGDSGGPLQTFIPGKTWCVLQVLGVTSFGKSCGSGVPGVYTKVRTYISWIESIVWP